MSDMKVHSLNVDLIQNSASISLLRADNPTGTTSTIVSINIPIGDQGDERESAIRKKAITRARDALAEAIRVLEAHAA